MSDNDALNSGKLIFVESSETDTTCPGSELRNNFAEVRLGSQNPDGDILCPKVVFSAVDVNFSRDMMDTVILVKAHTGKTTHTDIDNSADNIRMMYNTTIMQLKSLMFPAILHSSFLPEVWPWLVEKNGHYKNVTYYQVRT